VASPLLSNPRMLSLFFFTLFASGLFGATWWAIKEESIG